MDLSANPLALIVDGHTLIVNGPDGEPMIRDLDFADWLGFERPRNVRKLIARLVSVGILNDSDVRSTVEQQEKREQPGKRGGVRNGTEYHLTAAGAAKVAAKSETPRAYEVLAEVVRVWDLARRRIGEMNGPDVSALTARIVALEAQLLDAQWLLTSGSIVDRNPHAAITRSDHLTARIRSLIAAVANHWQVSWHRVEAVVRRRTGTASWKTMLIAESNTVISELEDYLHERLAFPGGTLREKPAAPPKPHQLTLLPTAT